MNDFPKPDSLSTLAAAREAYSDLLAAFHERDGELQALRDDLKAANELVDENAGIVAARDHRIREGVAKLTAAENDRETARQKATGLENEIATLKATIAQLEAAEKSAEAEAASICASVGVDPLLIKPEPEAKAQDLLQQFRAITDPGKRTAFFRQHKEQLLAQK